MVNKYRRWHRCWIFRLMVAEKVGLKLRTSPAGTYCTSSWLRFVVKCFVFASIDVHCVMSKTCKAISMDAACFYIPLYCSYEKYEGAGCIDWGSSKLMFNQYLEVVSGHDMSWTRWGKQNKMSGEVCCVFVLKDLWVAMCLGYLMWSVSQVRQ